MSSWSCPVCETQNWADRRSCRSCTLDRPWNHTASNGIPKDGFGLRHKWSRGRSKGAAKGRAPGGPKGPSAPPGVHAGSPTTKTDAQIKDTIGQLKQTQRNWKNNPNLSVASKEIQAQVTALQQQVLSTKPMEAQLAATANHLARQKERAHNINSRIKELEAELASLQQERSDCNREIAMSKKRSKELQQLLDVGSSVSAQHASPQSLLTSLCTAQLPPDIKAKLEEANRMLAQSMSQSPITQALAQSPMSPTTFSPVIHVPSLASGIPLTRMPTTPNRNWADMSSTARHIHFSDVEPEQDVEVCSDITGEDIDWHPSRDPHWNPQDLSGMVPPTPPGPWAYPDNFSTSQFGPYGPRLQLRSKQAPPAPYITLAAAQLAAEQAAANEAHGAAETPVLEPSQSVLADIPPEDFHRDTPAHQS